MRHWPFEDKCENGHDFTSTDIPFEMVCRQCWCVITAVDLTEGQVDFDVEGYAHALGAS